MKRMAPPARGRRRRAAFTLIEVLLVLVILVILASMGTLYIRNAQYRSKINATRAQIGAFETALENYQLDIGNYPPTLDGLLTPPADLPNPAKWGPSPYFSKNEIPLDQWDQAYQYELVQESESVQRFRLWSWGPDREDGTPDDIGNWQ